MGINNSYLETFGEFDEYVQKRNSETIGKNHEGYLVNFNELIQFRNEQIEKENKRALCDQLPRIQKLTPIQMDNLMYDLRRGNKFIIINSKLFQTICPKNLEMTHKINYIILPDKIIVSKDNDKQKMEFKRNKDNIIDQTLLIKQNDNNIEQLNVSNINGATEKIYIDIINYYENEKYFSDILKNINNQTEKCDTFLINKDWVDKWKKYSYYDYIKENYLQKKINEKNLIIKMIKEEQQKYHLNYDEINNIENFIIKEEKEITLPENSKKSFVLLNRKFLKQFDIKNSISPISLYLSHQTIEYRPKGKHRICFKTTNNIISIANTNNEVTSLNQVNSQIIPANNINNLEYLKHLIRTFYFQNEFILPNSIFRKKFSQAYLIKKELMIKLKEKFKFGEIKQLLDNNQNLNGIKYINLEQYFSKIFEFIKGNYIDYIKRIKQNEIQEIFNFNQNNLIPKFNNYPQNIKYIDDFEIIEPKFASFLKQKFGKDKKLFPLVNFSILENRIFLIINNESDNIYEIANFEYSKNLFNVEFIIEFISHKINNTNSFNNHLLEFFNNKGIQNLVSCRNPIKTENDNIIFNLHPINNSKNITINKDQEHAQNQTMIYTKKESVTNTENNNQFYQTSVAKESNPLKNEFNFNNPIYNNHQNNLRRSFNTTTSRMINQMKDSQTSSANKKRCYLIDIGLYEYLLHLYQNPDVHLNITQINYTKNILYENKVINSDDKNNYLIKFGFIYIKDKKFNFPNNFEIIDSDFLTQIKNRFGSEIPDKFIIQIRLIKIKGGIILIPKNKNVMNDEGNLIYLYSIQENEQKNKFKIKIIIDCRSGFGERINIFRSIIQIPNYENIIQNPKILENHNNLKYYIIPDNKYIDETPKNNEQNMDYYLMLLIIINRERNNLSTFIKQSHKKKTTEISECYLINKNYISVLNMFLPVLYINDIMNNNVEKNDVDILNIIKSNLPEEQKSKINLLQKDYIQKIFDNNQENMKLNLIYYHNNDFYSFNNCEIITIGILNKLKEIDNKINDKCLKINCVFDSNKIIILIKNKNIVISNYNEGNIIPEYIIALSDPILLFNKFKQDGYNFIIPYLQLNNTQININYNNSFYNVPLRIFKLENNEKKVSDFSDKLNCLVLKAIFNNNFQNHQLHNVYLINPEWLKQYNYGKIQSLVNKKYLEINNLKLNLNDMKNIPKIIEYINQEKMKKIDNDILSCNPNSSINFNSYIVKIKTQDKYIYVYNYFSLIKREHLIHFENNFGIKPITYDISYIHKKEEEDLIIIKKSKFFTDQNKEQNVIIFGKYDIDENKYKIKYIFDYNDVDKLNSEYAFLLNYEVKDYINNRTYLEGSNYFSPIFVNNQIIGNFYKYKEGFDYSQCINYYQYLNNLQLMNAIYLYSNKIYILNKIQNSSKNHNSDDEQFYLIKKKFITEMKNESYYNQLKQHFSGYIKKIPQTKEDIIYIIKKLFKNNSQFMYNIITQNNAKQTVQEDPTFHEIEVNPITNPNSSELYMIYHNFDLIEKNCSSYLLKDINKKKYTILMCSFIENYIILHYPPNLLGNKYYICVISNMDDNYNYINQYLLQYKDYESYKYHIDKIKRMNNLKNYFQSFNYVNGVAPIVRSEYIEIGNIIKMNVREPSPLHPHIPPRKYCPSKPLIGLENIGATCYMNATLQCFCNIEKFVDYFLCDKNLITITDNDQKNEKLCSSFRLLIENLYPYPYNPKNRSYAPREFKDKISKLNPLFEGIQANDSKDLVNFLILTLHLELNISPKNQLPENSNNVFEDQRNKQLMYNNFVNSFYKENNSIISQLFYALNYNYTQCANCNAGSYNYQVYFFLIFPLEEVRKFKLMNNNNNNGFNNINNNNNVVDIMDCFDFDRKVNFMTGDNVIYCNYCKQSCNSYMRTILATGPEILVILLNRGKGIEFNVKINFYLNLDLSNYIEMKNTGCQYELFGVITHIGESGMGGHFIAYCKDYINGKWMKINDAIVTPVNDFKTEVIDFAMPYLLFYQKKNNN